MRPRQFTDKELIAAARAMFLEHGPSVSGARIASELGISSAALFKRVGTKQELLRRALIGGDVPPFLPILENTPPDDRPVAEQLLEHDARIDAFFAKAMPAIAMLKAAGLCPHDVFSDQATPPPVRAVQALTKWFETLVEQGRVTVESPQALAIAILGSLQARYAIRSFLGDAYPDGGPNYTRLLVDTLLRGIDK